MDTKRRTSYTRLKLKRKRKGKINRCCCAQLEKSRRVEYYPPIPVGNSSKDNREHRASSFTLGDQAAAQKKASSRMKNCYFMKTKSGREKKRTFYCHCCRVCVVKGARRQKAATTSSAIVGLLRYVYMRIIWLIMPLFWLCEKGERSNLNSIKWFFFAHNFSSTWCIMVFKFVSEPELTRLLFCYRAEKEIVTVFFFFFAVSPSKMFS